jgi:peptidyl-dipeptidase A
MWRSKYDMPPDAFTGGRSAVESGAAAVRLAARLRAREAAREVRRRRAAPTARSPRTCSATSGRRTGATSTTLVAPKAERRRRLLDLTEDPAARKDIDARHGEDGERFFTSLGFAPLPKTFWERSLIVRPRIATSSATPARGTSTTSTTCASRCASSRRPRTSRPSTTSSATTSTSAPTTSSRFLPRQRERRLPRSDRRHDRAVGDAGVPREDRPARQGARPSRDIGLLLRDALDKVAFLPFGLLIDSGAGRCSPARSRRPALQQGVVGAAAEVPGRRAAGTRGEEFFDPARSTTSGNTPYTRYFLAASCSSSSTARCAKIAGCTGRSTAARSTTTRKRARARQDAGDGHEPPVAGRARSAHRTARDGRDGSHRLLPPLAIDAIEVIGAPLSLVARAVLDDAGFSRMEETPGGFRVRR